MTYKDVLKIIEESVDVAPTQQECLETAQQSYHIIRELWSLSRKGGKHNASECEGCYNRHCLGKNKLPICKNICICYSKSTFFGGWLLIKHGLT